MAKVELISQAEYSRRRGVDPTSVRDAIKGGRISLISGMIDPVVADAQWAANTRRRIHASDDATGPTRQPQQSAAAPASPPAPVQTYGIPDYQESRARREAAEAELAELRLAEEQGELIRADAVRSALSRRAAGLRDAILQVPSRLAAVLAPENDPARIHELLAAELRSVLLQLTEARD